MLFVWDDNYRTGVDEIDHDHKGLVNLINDLYEAMQLHGGSLRQRRTLHG
jgi:hemerythrin